MKDNIKTTQEYMIISGHWIVGFTDAEGCFSIYISNTGGMLRCSFRFYLSQKDTEPLYKCLEYFESRVKQLGSQSSINLPKLTPGNGTMDVEFIQHDLLLLVIKPFFEEFSLLTSKYHDFQLFYAALEIQLNPAYPKPLKIIYIANIMFAMNTKGEARKYSLLYYEELVRTSFVNDIEWVNARESAKNYVKAVILQANFPELLNIHPDYFIGLVVGDGCFHADFDLRKGRKATVRKAFSISLLKTDRNEQLLDAIAQQFNFVWKKRPSSKGRHQFEVGVMETINRNLQPFFLSNFEKMPVFRQKQFKIWFKIDRLLTLLPVKSKDTSTAVEIKALLTEIYYAHGGTTRRYTLEEVLLRFQRDWMF